MLNVDVFLSLTTHKLNPEGLRSADLEPRKFTQLVVQCLSQAFFKKIQREIFYIGNTCGNTKFDAVDMKGLYS